MTTVVLAVLLAARGHIPEYAGPCTIDADDVRSVWVDCADDDEGWTRADVA